MKQGKKWPSEYVLIMNRIKEPQKQRNKYLIDIFRRKKEHLEKTYNIIEYI